MQGGVGAYTSILAQTLVTQGHDVFVFTDAKATVQTHNDYSVQVTARVNRWSLMSLFSVKTWARERNLDLINLQFQTAAFAMSPYVHFLPDVLHPIPVVTTFHDLRFPYLFPKAGKLRNWIVKRLARSSSGVIVTNHEDALALHDLPHKSLIPIGSNILQPLPPDFDPDALRAQNGAENPFLLVYFGLINRTKGLETLLSSLSALRADGLDARLVIIGGTVGSSDPSNTAYLHEVNMLIDHLGLAPFIHRTGYADDQTVGMWLSASDAAVLPFRDGASFRRGSLMAAIQYGCAIITTSPAVTISDFMNGENMLLHPIDDPAALADAVCRIQQSPELAAKLKHGAQQLAAHFQWDQIARDCVSFFTHVLEERA
jgi:glycosyltransferase involved in cell wall biosynthesis